MALNAATVFDISPAGSDTNGGGFYAGRAGATKTATDNYTYGASKTTIAYTDIYSNGTNLNTLKSDARGFVAADTGHLIYLASGTNLTTAGWFEITSVAANVATLDRNCWSAANSTKDGVATLGGSLLSPGGLGAVWAGTNQGTSGQTAWINAGTYALTTASSNVSTGVLSITSGQVVYIYGYNVTRPAMAAMVDLGANKPLIQIPNNGTVTSCTIINQGQMGNGSRFVNLKVDGQNQTAIIGFATSGGNDRHTWLWCHADKCSGGGFSNGVFYSCKATTCGTPAFNGLYAHDCHADATAGNAFVNLTTVVNCIASNSTSSGNGFWANKCLYGCTAYNNAAAGANRGSGITDSRFVNCVLSKNGASGVGINTDGSSMFLVNCAFYLNAVSEVEGVVGVNIGSLTLSQQPFVSVTAGSEDYRPNNVAGGGAALRAAGIGIIGQTTNRNLGAVQHTDLVVPIATNVRIGIDYGALEGTNSPNKTTGTKVIDGEASYYATLAKTSNSFARGGTGTCFLFTPTSTTLYGYWDFYIVAKAGKKLSFSFYYAKIAGAFGKDEVGDNGAFKVSMWDTDGNTLLINSASVDLSAVDTNYHQHVCTQLTTTGDGMCRVRLEIKNGVTSGAVYVDDMATSYS